MSGWRKVGDLVLLLSRPQVEIEIIKIVQLITKRKKLSGQRIAQLFQEFKLCLFCFEKCTRNQNKTKIICSTDCKTFQRILTLSILFQTNEKKFKTVQQVSKRNKLFAERLQNF